MSHKPLRVFRQKEKAGLHLVERGLLGVGASGLEPCSGLDAQNRQEDLPPLVDSAHDPVDLQHVYAGIAGDKVIYVNVDELGAAAAPHADARRLPPAYLAMPDPHGAPIPL